MFGSTEKRKPWGLAWRSSYWFVTLVVFIGIAVDLLVYSIVVPVFPFRFQELGYNNVSSLTGWLLFAYSAGLVLSTLPIAAYSENSQQRKWPLAGALVLIIGSQIMLMEAPNFAVMCVARVLQGIGSTVVWVLGLALLCDSTPETLIGRQLGIVVSGYTIGLLIGPAVGGALYDSMGFRSPFIFGVIAAAVDLIGRLIIIERKDALVWGHDPAALQPKPLLDTTADEKATTDEKADEGTSAMPENGIVGVLPPSIDHADAAATTAPALPLWNVVVIISKTRRAMVAGLLAAVYGLIFSAQDPTLPVHLEEVWGLKSTVVGLVFLAMVAATIITSPIAGWLTDRMPAGRVLAPCFLLAIPWIGITILEKHLALFIVAFAVQTGFSGAGVAPLTAELAAVARNDPRIGYAHIYGVFNIAFGIGSALGPIYGAQILDHVHRGWMVICVISMSLLFLSVILVVLFIDEKPMFFVALEKLRLRKSQPNTQEEA